MDFAFDRRGEAFFTLRAAELTLFFALSLDITPPKEPPARSGKARGQRECQGLPKHGLPRLVRPNERPEAAHPARSRRRFALRGRRLRGRAWRLRASEPFRRRRRGIAPGVHSLRR